MKPAEYTLYIRRGSTLNKQLTLTDAAGNAIDLTNYTVKSQIRDRTGGYLRTDITTTINSPGTLGQIVLSLTAGQTQALTLKPAVYDVRLTRNDGWVGCLIAGPVVIEACVTIDPES